MHKEPGRCIFCSTEHRIQVSVLVSGSTLVSQDCAVVRLTDSLPHPPEAWGYRHVLWARKLISLSFAFLYMSVCAESRSTLLPLSTK